MSALTAANGANSKVFQALPIHDIDRKRTTPLPVAMESLLNAAQKKTPPPVPKAAAQPPSGAKEKPKGSMPGSPLTPALLPQALLGSPLGLSSAAKPAPDRAPPPRPTDRSRAFSDAPAPAAKPAPDRAPPPRPTDRSITFSHAPAPAAKPQEKEDGSSRKGPSPVRAPAPKKEPSPIAPSLALASALQKPREKAINEEKGDRPLAPKRPAPRLGPLPLFYEGNKVDVTQKPLSSKKLKAVLGRLSTEDLFAMMNLIYLPELNLGKKINPQILSISQGVSLSTTQAIIEAFKKASEKAYDMEPKTRTYYHLIEEDKDYWSFILKKNSHIIGAIMKALLVKADSQNRDYDPNKHEELIPEYTKFLVAYRVKLIVENPKRISMITPKSTLASPSASGTVALR